MMRHFLAGQATMIGRLKEKTISLLEKHPYGYALGLAILESNPIFLPHESDFHGMLLVAANRTGLFLDVGANRGHSALGFHKIMPGWCIFSIEANLLHQSRLESLKQRHSFFDYRIAAADRVSGHSVTIWTPRYGRLYCHSAAAIDRAEAVRAIRMSFPAQAPYFEYVPQETFTLALDDLNLAPQIIKMDVQGNELAALYGLAATIRRHRPSFLIECNLEGDDIFKAMRNLEYEPYSYDRGRNCLIRATQSSMKGRNVFFIPAERAPCQANSFRVR
jgi:FkbM family methyltransferase